MPRCTRVCKKIVNGEVTEPAEGARLEIVCTGNTGTEGSNPSLSAMFF
ncbi:hypothetical protein DSUL_40071 [Desulfovibrionales bacterium]